jgi:hypothetical protein
MWSETLLNLERTLMEVTDTAVSLGTGAKLIQNLGPDALYLGDAEVSDETGVLLEANTSLVVGQLNQSLYAISANTSDVRVLARGQGIFPSFVVTP